MDTSVAEKYIFISGKGGVGKSTLSAVFAKLLHARGFRVLIMDGDVSLRTLDILFAVTEKVVFDWYDVISGSADPEAALVETTGPKLLAAPACSVSVASGDMKKLIKRYEKDFDIIVIDCPAGVGPVFSAALEVADKALVVTTPDAAAARNASVAADLADGAGVPVRLIINRLKKENVKAGKAMNLDEAVDATGVRLLGVVPEDGIMALGLSNGEPVERSLPGVRAMDRIIDRLAGKDVPLKI